ncbi:MAG TPA: alpha/beta fold hydrolase, partial [Myxococcota bacterium]|nr:alpha/beta fold hydrolase [Myxococcota bacterium]
MTQETTIRVGELDVPLEFESTAALAFGLEGAPIWDFDLAGFRFGDFVQDPAVGDGLILLGPYRPGRVPVVLVHGTASNPARWAELVNEIYGDPALSESVQIWLFLYNTGNPILMSASRLREALRATVRDLDPESRDPALQQMVVIGHSQGGLLTKLQAVTSGSAFWDAAFDEPFERARLSPETRDLVSRFAFFEALPFVRRLVFISTPHGGSYLASRRIGALASRLVKFPGELVRRGAELATLNADGGVRGRFSRVQSSVDNMKPGNPFLQALSSLPLAPGVVAHSIIPVKKDGPPEGQNDGVVEYSAAHIDGVESELIVRSPHSVQGNPRAVAEVKRILREHLAAIEAATLPSLRQAAP